MNGPDSGAAVPVARDPLKLRTEWAPFMTRWDVILSDDGLAWQRDGSEAGP